MNALVEQGPAICPIDGRMSKGQNGKLVLICPLVVRPRVDQAPRREGRTAYLGVAIIVKILEQPKPRKAQVHGVLTLLAMDPRICDSMMRKRHTCIKLVSDVGFVLIMSGTLVRASRWALSMMALSSMDSSMSTGS